MRTLTTDPFKPDERFLSLPCECYRHAGIPAGDRAVSYKDAIITNFLEDRVKEAHAQMATRQRAKKRERRQALATSGGTKEASQDGSSSGQRNFDEPPEKHLSVPGSSSSSTFNSTPVGQTAPVRDHSPLPEPYTWFDFKELYYSDGKSVVTAETPVTAT